MTDERMIVPDDVRGLIFDCDGTIADTMPIHYEAWCAALQEHAVEFPEAIFYEFAGMPTPKIIETLNERHGHSMPVEETAHRKELLFEQRIPEVRAIEPVVKLAEQYRGKLPMAVATGGMRHICMKTLTALGIADWFDTVVTADDVAHGKPAPDIFLEAALRIDVPPEKCLAFEDGELGIQSALAAGMRVIDVRRYLPSAR
ncbi:MAG TPA: HAD family phosphatase [Tepidisphaeraceae bacterium]|nr:HAD family phosphatase [Tepidisphaeraceae bacterium]